jgi:hypothetical protein
VVFLIVVTSPALLSLFLPYDCLSSYNVILGEFVSDVTMAVVPVILWGCPLTREEAGREQPNLDLAVANWLHGDG